MPEVTFAEALSAAVAAVEATGVDLAGAEATLLRDVFGCLRLYVVPRSESKLDAQARRKLGDALASVQPYGTSAVHVEPPQFALKALVERERRPLDVSVAERSPRWFHFERRLSKDAWLDETGVDREPWPLGDDPENGAPQAPLVVSFFGFKGGVGRTTALAAFALHLSDAGRSVVVLDLDIESPGVGTLLTAGADVDLGVVDFLLEERLPRADPLPLSRFYLLSPHVTERGALRVVCAGRLDGSYIEKLGRVDLQGSLEPGRGAAHGLLRLLERIRDELRPHAILLDVRAGLHDLGGISLAGLSHMELVFAVHSSQTWAGLPLVMRHLGRLRAPWVKLIHALVPPKERGGDRAHEEFVRQAYDVCCEHYYREDDVPDLLDDSAAHRALRLPHREALMGLSDLAVSRGTLLSDEHRLFCEELARQSGLGD